jgi:hypothetical protein
MTPFGEAIEFDYSKSVRLIINAFRLLDIGKSRPIKLTASIDAACLTKKIPYISWCQNDIRAALFMVVHSFLTCNHKIQYFY